MKNKQNTEEYERCVMCGALTGVLKSVPIELRDNYIVGCGQICIECKHKLYKFEEEENNNIRTEIMRPMT